MNPAQAAKVLKLIPWHQPIMLHGPPGTGKSSICRQYAEELDVKMIDLRGTLLNPVDLRGLPHIRGQLSQLLLAMLCPRAETSLDDVREIISDMEKAIDEQPARWAIPTFLPNVERHGERGILLLDEINLAPKQVQAAMYQIIHDRRCGEWEMPEGWRTIACGNRLTDRCGVTEMSFALKNRFLHIEVDADLGAWRSWAARNRVHPHVVAFLERRPKLLLDMQSGEESNAFPTPRSWEYVSRILHAYEKEGSDEALLILTVEGCVGRGATQEFMGFWRIAAKLPDIESLLRSSKEAEAYKMPDEPDILHALAASLGYFVGKATVRNYWTLVNKMPAEFAYCAVKDAYERLKDVIERSDEGLAWCAKHKRFFVPVS